MSQSAGHQVTQCSRTDEFISRVQGSRELFKATLDSLEALDSAFHNAGRLHRDISIDKIILYRYPGAARRTGLLVDWNLSTHADRSGKARDYMRSGTWAQMSVKALGDGDDFRYSREDDTESLFYVVTYDCVRWLPHKGTLGLGRWIADFFDSSMAGENGQDKGGALKALAIIDGGHAFLNKFDFENKHIQLWFSRTFRRLLNFKQQTGTTAADRTPAWSPECFREIFLDVLKGLASTDGSDRDRIEHKVNDYYVPANEPGRSTYSKISNLTRKALAGSASMHPSSKRPLAEPVEGPAEVNDVELRDPQVPESKRRRPLRPEGPVSTVDAETTSKRSLRSAKSARKDPTLDDGSSKANVLRPRSRRSTKSLQNRSSASGAVGKRRSARLSAKQSGSSLRRQT